MPSNPLTVFQTTYVQLVSNGMTTGAAQLGAQTAMQATLAQQNSRSSVVAQPVQAVQSGRVPDMGPTSPPPKRSK